VPILASFINSSQNLPRMGSMGQGWGDAKSTEYCTVQYSVLLQNTVLQVDSFIQKSHILIDGSTFSDPEVKVKVTI